MSKIGQGPVTPGRPRNPETPPSTPDGDAPRPGNPLDKPERQIDDVPSPDPAPAPVKEPEEMPQEPGQHV